MPMVPSPQDPEKVSVSEVRSVVMVILLPAATRGARGGGAAESASAHNRH
jgi:hypothetical protein